jgi:ribonuclease-3
MAGEVRRRRLRALLARAGAAKADASAFEAAFVHESAAREGRAARSNERLEFLGDAVLGLIVARSLYDRFPDAPEGELALRKSTLVADAELAATAERLGFEPLLVLSAGLANLPSARRRSALADAFEAFLAVLHRECGFETAAAFVAREHIAACERRGTAIGDPKTILQEWTQRRFGTVPAYEDRFEGPPHERTFFAEVAVGDGLRASGTGPSKKAAQRAAASAVLDVLAERYDDVAPRALTTAGGAGDAGAAPATAAGGGSTRRYRRRAGQTTKRSASKRSHS